jgi:putative ABC transport system permease protein
VTSRSFRKLFQALVLRPLRREPGRSLLTIAGVAVGIAVMVAIHLANQSAVGSFEEAVEAVAGRANYQLTPASGMMAEEVLLQLQPFWRLGVSFVPIIDRDGSLLRDGRPVRVFATDLLSDLQFRDYRFTRVAAGDQNLPASRAESWFLRLLGESSAIIPAELATDLGVGIGDRLLVNLDGSRAELVIRGVLEPEGPAPAFSGRMIIVDIAVAQAAFPALAGRLSRIDLIIPADSESEIVEELQSRLPPGILLERPSRRTERVDQMLRAFRVNLLALAAVSLVVGVFLVYNTVLVSVLRRRGLIGTMRTLGVGTRPIFISFLLEGAVFGLLGSLLGTLLGVAIAGMLLDLVSRTVSTLYVRTAPSVVELDPLVAVVAVATGVVISAAAAAQPAAEAASRAPLALVQQSSLGTIRPGRVILLATLGTVSFLFAWIASLIPPLDSLPVGGYLAVLLVITGFSLLTPAGVRVIARILKPMFRSLFGIAGRLASASMPASLRRTSIAAAALLIAIAMMIAVSLMIGSFRKTVDLWIDQTLSSDLWLRPAATLDSAAASFPDAILRDLERLDFVAASDPFRGREVLIGGRLAQVGSGDFRTLMQFGNLPMIQPSSLRRALGAALADEGALVSESFSNRFDLRVGDSVVLPTIDGPRAVPVRGIYRDYSSDRGVVIIDRELYIRFYQDDAIDSIAIFLSPGVDLDQARRSLEDALSARWNAFAFTNRTIRAEVLRIFDQTFLVTWALLAIALTVAILGIVSTLSALIIERRREIALLRVAGMRRSEVRRMIVLEATILGVSAMTLGAACGYLLSLILIFVINLQSFGWTIDFHVPWKIIAGSLAATFLTTVAAGYLSAGLADRVEIARELQSE